MAGLEGLHPHMLRRTYGQIRRASGASIEVVAREMGHASIDTTVRYTMPIGDTWDVVESSFL
jgi:site-specific recombinase XerD